jgi:hypothetical protein
MPLDEATRRFAFLLQGDLRRFTERREAGAARGEEIRFDSVSRIAVVETPRGDAVGRLYGEVLATYAAHDRILRWSWAGRSSSGATTHADVVFREGQARGVPQLAMSVVGDLDEDEAKTLVELGALMARAEAVHGRVAGAEVEFLGLFERPRPSDGSSVPPPRESRISVPPPPVTARSDSKAPPPRAYRSIPPIREIFEPRTSSSPPRSPPSVPPRAPADPAATRSVASSPPPGATAPTKLREPSRALFLPAASAALAALARSSKGYLQGLFVVTLDGREGAEPRPAGRQGIVVQLVAIDAAGILRALDPPAELVEAAAAMVAADLREGNGHWRKLSARITPKPDGGATLHVDVT